MTRNWEGLSSKVNNFNIWACAASKSWHSNWRVENWRWHSEVSENYNPDFLLEKLIWILAHSLMRLLKMHSFRKTWETPGGYTKHTVATQKGKTWRGPHGPGAPVILAEICQTSDALQSMFSHWLFTPHLLKMPTQMFHILSFKTQ